MKKQKIQTLYSLHEICQHFRLYNHLQGNVMFGLVSWFSLHYTFCSLISKLSFLVSQENNLYINNIQFLTLSINSFIISAGVFSSLNHVIQKEGFIGLYKGNGVQMLRIFPYSAIQFAAYEEFKKVCVYCMFTKMPPPNSLNLEIGMSVNLAWFVLFIITTLLSGH